MKQNKGQAPISESRGYAGGNQMCHGSLPFFEEANRNRTGEIKGLAMKTDDQFFRVSSQL